MKEQRKNKCIPKHVKNFSADEAHFLILYNDDIHTIDYVTDSLVTICGHSPEQALQCTIIIHNKGSYEVRKGTINYLTPMKTALSEKQLKATIK